MQERFIAVPPLAVVPQNFLRLVLLKTKRVHHFATKFGQVTDGEKEEKIVRASELSAALSLPSSSLGPSHGQFYCRPCSARLRFSLLRPAFCPWTQLQQVLSSDRLCSHSLVSPQPCPVRLSSHSRPRWLAINGGKIFESVFFLQLREQKTTRRMRELCLLFFILLREKYRKVSSSSTSSISHNSIVYSNPLSVSLERLLSCALTESE